MGDSQPVAAQSRSVSPVIVGAWLLLVIFIGVHYVTNDVATAHYLSIALVAAAVVLLGASLSPVQGALLALGASATVVGDAIWFGGAPGEIVLEAASLISLPAVLWLARSAATEIEPVPETYYWDAAAGTSTGRYLTQVEAAFIERALQPHGRVACAVDAGAGAGRISRVLAERADRVVAIEVNQALLPALAAVARNVAPVVIDENAALLPLRDGSVECITAIEVPDLAQREWFWRESARVLAPGGRLLLTLQNRRSWKGLLARADRARYRARFGAEYYEMSYGELVSGLAAAGLTVDEASGFNWLPFRRGSDSPLVGPLAAIERLSGLRFLPAVSPWVILSVRRDS